jgi:alpha/beta superfamily hydrolase
VDEVVVTEAVKFVSGPFLLEGELMYPEQRRPLAGAVVAGPHPLLGGTMSNNVVAALTLNLARHGLATLRFNYRGTGGSEGPSVDLVSHLAEFWKTSHVPEEAGYQEDMASACAFLQELVGEETSLVRIGYSFGCSLLPCSAGMRSPSVLIAPTIGTHDYEPFTTLRSPLLLIASDDDFATKSDRLQEWFDRLIAPRRWERGRFDNHFFRGHEEWLSDVVLAFLQEEGGIHRCP